MLHLLGGENGDDLGEGLRGVPAERWLSAEGAQIRAGQASIPPVHGIQRWPEDVPGQGSGLPLDEVHRIGRAAPPPPGAHAGPPGAAEDGTRPLRVHFSTKEPRQR